MFCKYCNKKMQNPVEIGDGFHHACYEANIRKLRVLHTKQRYENGVFCNCCDKQIYSEDENAVPASHNEKHGVELIAAAQSDLCFKCQECTLDQIHYNHEIFHNCCHGKNHNLVEPNGVYFVFSSTEEKPKLKPIVIPEVFLDWDGTVDRGFVCHVNPEFSFLERVILSNLSALSERRHNQCVILHTYTPKGWGTQRVLRLVVNSKMYELTELFPHSSDDDFDLIEKRVSVQYPVYISSLLKRNTYSLDEAD